MKMNRALNPATTTAVVAVGLAIALIVVHLGFPDLDNLALLIGGVAGCTVVIYGTWQSRRFAEGGFIHELNDSFTSNPSINFIWDKILFDREITQADSDKLSAYLTFFETIYMLHQRNTLDIDVIDHLFRSKFFKAIGNRWVQETVLIKHYNSFSSIHLLSDLWYNHLLAKRIVPLDYYNYRKAVTERLGYSFVQLGPEDFADLQALNNQILDHLDQRSWFRANTEEDLRNVLTNYVIGFRSNNSGQLVAACVLLDAGSSEENIAKYRTRDPAQVRASINLKIIMVLPSQRRDGLARTLVELAQQKAVELGRAAVRCTIHPHNLPSRRLFLSLGYKKEASRVRTSYGRRDVFKLELR